MAHPTDSTARVRPENTIEAGVRTLHCLFGMLHHQQKDELCRNCKSFAVTLEAARKKLIETEACVTNWSGGESARALMLSIYGVLGDIVEPEHPAAQRKTGACSLPNGLCMLKEIARLAGCAEFLG